MKKLYDKVNNLVGETIYNKLPIETNEIGWEIVGEDTQELVQQLLEIIYEESRKARVDELDRITLNAARKQPTNNGAVFSLKSYYYQRIRSLQQKRKNK